MTFQIVTLENRTLCSLTPLVVDTPDQPLGTHLVSGDIVYYTRAASDDLSGNRSELHRFRISTGRDELIRSPDGVAWDTIQFHSLAGNKLIFTASAKGGSALWSLDRVTGSEPTLLTHRRMNFAGSFAGTRDGLYFVASDAAHGQELWYTDTTHAAAPITSFMPGTRWSDISDLHTSPLGQAYFVHEDGLYRIVPDQQPRLLHQSAGSIDIITHFATGVAAVEQVGANVRVVAQSGNNPLTFATGSFDRLNADSFVIATGSLVMSGYDSSGDQRLWAYGGGANPLKELPDIAPDTSDKTMRLHAVDASMSQYVSISMDGIGSFLVNADRSQGSKWGAFKQALRIDGRYYYINSQLELFETESLRARGELIGTGISRFENSRYGLSVKTRDGLYVLDPSKRSVLGQVWLDRNQDGRYSRNQQLDRGVLGITVFADTNDNGVLDRGEPLAVTRHEGRYRLYGLPFGEVPIRVTDLYPGYRAFTPDRVVASVGSALPFVDFGLTTKPAA